MSAQIIPFPPHRIVRRSPPPSLNARADALLQKLQERIAAAPLRAVRK